MNSVRCAFVIPGILILSACADGLTDPPPLSRDDALSPPHSPLLGTVTPIDGEEECDPWMDLNWCQCEDGADDPDCDGGGGDDGGDDGNDDGGGASSGGPDGDGDGDGDHDELSVCPNCEALDFMEHLKLFNSADHICHDGRNPVKNALMGGEWSKRESDYFVRGWHHLGYHEGASDYHYSINQNHPGFTGVMEDFTQIDEHQQQVELAGTLVHEYFHHVHPDENESQIRNRTHACVPGYLGG